jgi:hypothetical protein
VIVGQQAPPVPPVPPAPPGSELAVTGSFDGWEAVLLLLVAAGLLVVILWPLLRAVGRRIEAGAGTAEAAAELEGLRERVRVLEEAQPRLAELEERVDFAERLLAQQREPDRLQR